MLTSPRKMLASLVLLILIHPACQQPAPHAVEQQTMSDDGQAPFDPQETYPAWAYDQPEYAKPIDDLQPAPRAMPNDPLHYFTNNRMVMVRQPGGYNAEEIPRVAIWWTDDNGYHWHKAGFFGRSQTHFPLITKEDGDFGVRFVGPGQPPAEHTVAYPERMYHVDTALPEVEVWVSPEQTWYNAGDLVTISWRATDSHLVEFPVRIGMLMDFTADDHRMIELQRDLADEGSFTYKIPADAVDHEIWFRVEATDRAENVGLAYSFALQIVERPFADGMSPQEPMQLPAGESPKPVESSITFNESAADLVAFSESSNGDIVGNCETPVTADEARMIIDQAAIEFDAFVASFIKEIHAKAEYGRGLVAARATPEVVQILATDGDVQPDVDCDDAEAPAFASVDVTSIQASPIYNSRVETTTIDPVEAEEPCDETTTFTPAIASATVGAMSLPSGELPFATAASRAPVDDTQEIIDAPVAGVFHDEPRASEPRATAVVAFKRANRPQSSNDEVKVASTTPAASTKDVESDAGPVEFETDPSASPFTYQNDGWTFSGLSPSDVESFDGVNLAAFDPTAGNGLLVPMPATVERPKGEAVASRPWQALGTQHIRNAEPEAIWNLPRQTQNFVWRADREGRFLADHPSMRNFAEPTFSPNFAGMPMSSDFNAD